MQIIDFRKKPIAHFSSSHHSFSDEGLFIGIYLIYLRHDVKLNFLKTEFLSKPYKYRLRPGYGSDKLLLEFNLDNTNTEFEKDILSTLRDFNIKVDEVEDRFLNDEVVLHISSDLGLFELSKDIWGFAFIMAEENQSAIKQIDAIISKSCLFEKEEVDFEKYKNGKL